MKLKSFIHEQDVRRLIAAHTWLQFGCYFSSIELFGSGTLATSDCISDHYWNLLSCFNENEFEDLPLFDEKIKRTNRMMSVYIDPTIKGSEIFKTLSSQNFAVEREIWMEAPLNLRIKDLAKVDDLTIVQATGERKEQFLEVFSSAFGGESTTSDGYGDLPDDYLVALRRSLNRRNNEKLVEHLHFIALFNDEPVGCGSVHIGGQFGGLYNVGTLPKYRKMGIGTAVSTHAFIEAKKRNVRQLFFQTQPGGSVQRFYEGYGCRVIFEAALMYQDKNKAIRTKPNQRTTARRA